MSGRNGDKARFHKDRKKKLARRKRNWEHLGSMTGQRRAAKASSGSKPEGVTA
jgi:hypothetical protein